MQKGLRFRFQPSRRSRYTTKKTTVVRQRCVRKGFFSPVKPTAFLSEFERFVRRSETTYQEHSCIRVFVGPCGYIGFKLSDHLQSSRYLASLLSSFRPVMLLLRATCPLQILARDRLLGSYQVKPILNRLKQTLLGAGGGLIACAVSLALLLQAGEPKDFMARNREIAAALAAKGLPR